MTANQRKLDCECTRMDANKFATNVRARRSSGGEPLWSVKIGPRVSCPGACLAQHGVKRAAPANVPAVAHPHRSSGKIVEPNRGVKNVALGNSREPPV
jgi:hypothetical protein